jgi:hypothetical protein
MSRFNPHHDLHKLFDVVTTWKEHCLKHNGGLLSEVKEMKRAITSASQQLL